MRSPYTIWSSGPGEVLDDRHRNDDETDGLQEKEREGTASALIKVENAMAHAPGLDRLPSWSAHQRNARLRRECVEIAAGSYSNHLGDARAATRIAQCIHLFHFVFASGPHKAWFPARNVHIVKFLTSG
jgi:hypothetical protein